MDNFYRTELRYVRHHEKEAKTSVYDAYIKGYVRQINIAQNKDLLKFIIKLRNLACVQKK